ncbi:hypothetical protein NMG60_11027367 [Bertholletia excelsa]
MEKSAGKQRETEADFEKLLNEIRTLSQWHPSKRQLCNFAHEHPLTFHHGRKTGDTVRCHACKSPIENAMYGCAKCPRTFLHKACAEFPEKINHHPSHKSHQLELVQHVSRSPPLSLDADTAKRRCSLCDLPIRDTTTYCCKSCEVYLHKYCLELPEKIEHADHPFHRLSLNPDSIGSSATDICSACSKAHKDLNYSCDNCDFNLGLLCIIKGATSRAEGASQGHILTFLEEQPDENMEDQCLTCGENFGLQPVFRCEECEFSLHFQCVMKPTWAVLPGNMKYEKHLLKLTDAQADFCWSEAYCDACQEPLDFKNPLYYCSDCDFSAHLKCAVPDLQIEEGSRPKMSELQNSVSDMDIHAHPLHLIESAFEAGYSFDCGICYWEGDPSLPVYACNSAHEDEDCDFMAHLTCVLRERKLSFAHKLDSMVLDTTAVVITNPALTANVIINSLKDDESRKLSNIIKTAIGQSEEGSQNKFPSDEPQEYEPLNQILEKFESKCRDPRSALTYYVSASKVTGVNGYIVSENLAPVLKLLLSKYGDFSSKSQFSPAAKTFVFMVLCAALYSICTTKESDISEIQLFTCRDCFRIARLAKFKVGFAFKRLRKAMYAYFGVRDAAASAEALNQLDSEMAKLSEHMKILQEKCEKRMTSLLSYTKGDTMEIVGEKGILNSWDEYGDSIEAESGEDSIITEEDTIGENSEDSDPPISELEEQDEKQDTTGEIPEQETPAQLEPSDVAEDDHSGNPKTESVAEDNPEDLLDKIKNYVESHHSKRSLSYFANRHYSVKEKSDKVVCHKCKKIADDPTQGCKTCTNIPELPSKILCNFHEHPLGLFLGRNKEKTEKSALTKKKAKDEALCLVCGLSISHPTYRCAKCNIFLHKFCVQFPPKIDNHPLHPTHTLFLEENSKRMQKITCNGCGEKCRGCAFRCEECKFFVEIQCLFLVPTIQSQHHAKLLLFLEERRKNSLHGCFVCKGKISRPPFLRCGPCNVSLHFKCALPPEVDCTRCGEKKLSLALPHSYTFDKSESLLCTVCNKKRNPVLPIYYCQECHRPAHIDCVN